MPSAILEVFASASLPVAAWRRAPKVTLSRAGFATVTLPITDPEVEHSDWAGNWAEQSRPGGSPLLGYAGGRLPKQRLKVTVDEDVLDRIAFGSIPDQPAALAETCIAQIAEMTTPGPPVTVGYSTLEAGTWRITDMTVTTHRRHPDDNRVLTATVDLTLTAASDPLPISLAPAAPDPIQASTPAPPTTQPDVRRYTVKKGDTLFAIAQKSYGNGNVWAKIAAANNIRDPRALKVGQVLTLP